MFKLRIKRQFPPPTCLLPQMFPHHTATVCVLKPLADGDPAEFTDVLLEFHEPSIYTL